jgi:glycine/D-amino acid oxidase-like deaminating enzyme
MYEDKSFWARDYGPYTPEPTLQESIKVDVAIVGGGFLGLNTAREFKKDNPNARLAVLEGDVVGFGASGRNAGFSMTLFGLEPQVTRMRWGRQRTVDAYRYMVRSVNYTKELIESNQLDSDYSHPGFLRVAYSDSQVKTLKGVLTSFQDLGLADEMGMRWVEQEALRDEFNSPMFTAGLEEIHTGLLHPTKHVRELKRLALAAGAEVYEQTPVTLIRRQGNEVVLTTPGGTVRANKVVLATNAYTHLLKGLKKTSYRQFPMWTSVIVTERLTDEQWASIGWARRQGLEDVRQLLHYFRPTADGRILIGGQDVHAPWGMFEDLDHDHNPRTWRGLEAHLKHMFPSLRDVKTAYRWSGAVSINADMTPEIGFVGDERIICSTGCMGHGVSLTHLNGRLVADLLNDNKTELTDFWIVNRRAIRLPGKVLSYLGTKAVRHTLRTADRIFERNMPGTESGAGGVFTDSP